MIARCLVSWPVRCCERVSRGFQSRYGRNKAGNPGATFRLHSSGMLRSEAWPVLLSVAVALAGCASYSGIHGEAHALAPQSLAFDQNQGGGDWPREDWWTMFGDPKLGALVRQALEGNPSQRAAQARVRAAGALADAAGASLYPRLDLDASATRQRISANDIDPPPFGGSCANQGRIAVRQSDQQIASLRGDVSAAEAAVQLDRHHLAALLGLRPDAPLEVEQALHPYGEALALPANLPADLLARRPDIAAQRWRLEAAAAQIGAAKADFLPNVNLAAFVGFGATGLEGLNLASRGSGIAGVGPALHLPIFDAGRLRANLRGRYGEYDAAVEQYNQALVDALRQVADQITAARAVQQQLADQANALAAAEDAYRLTLDRYRAGLTSYLDVLGNEERVLAERLNGVRLQGRSLALAVGTIRALGGGYHVDS